MSGAGQCGVFGAECHRASTTALPPCYCSPRLLLHPLPLTLLPCFAALPCCPAAEEATMVQFQAAMALTGAEFSEAVQYYAKVGRWAVQLW